MSPDNWKKQLQDIPIPADIRHRSRLGIEQAIQERQADDTRKRRTRRRTGAIAAAVVLLFLSAALLNRTSVWAAIQKALQFVPGIGMIKEEDSPAERYILKEPITVNVGEGSVVITGILSDEEMTYITMAAKDTPRLEYVTFVNAAGAEYRLESSTASWSSDQWTSGFWYEGKLDAGGAMKLILPAKPAEIEVPVALKRSKTYADYSEMGETASANGISITAIADRIGDKVRVSLIARHPDDFTISDYGIYGVYMHDESMKLNVVDETGRKLAIEHIRGVSSPAREFYFPLSGEERHSYTLTLPEISATYNDETSVKIPAETKENVNQTFEIAGFPVTITKTEKIGENGLRVYLDFHYNERASASLYSFGIEGLSSSAKLNERTGAMEYMEFEVEPGSKQAKIKLNRPEVVIRGPWKFELSDENFR